MNQKNPEEGFARSDTNGKEPIGEVLVCGGGVAGIQASIDLSAAGFRVHLLEHGPAVGGGMARLDKTFPTGDCATCIISPKLVECMRDQKIAQAQIISVNVGSEPNCLQERIGGEFRLVLFC